MILQHYCRIEIELRKPLQMILGVLLFEVWCCVLDAKEMLKNVLGRFVSKGVCGNGGRNSRPPCLYVPASYFRSGQYVLIQQFLQPYSAPRSFFGVEDYLDDDNSRPYTYQKEKKSKNPHKHISFKQRTVAFMEPFTLDIFISKRFVQASITHRVTSKQVAVAGTNSKDIKAALPSRCDIPACLAVGRFLAERAREADVYTASYTPRERDKFEGKIRAVVQSIIDNGIDIKIEIHFSDIDFTKKYELSQDRWKR
ncbi:hypothetical protein AKJ16_DCAP03895 [Drosera capensis]